VWCAWWGGRGEPCVVLWRAVAEEAGVEALAEETGVESMTEF
jgi:hypothetical protein